MIKVQGIDHVALSVTQLHRALKFYTEVLGLKESQREHQKPGSEIFLDCGSSLVGLIQAEEMQPAHLLQGKGIGGDHFAFRVKSEDFDKIVAELKERDVHIHFSKKRDRSWSVYFEDPDGNKLEMTAWPKEDGENGSN
jgi:glyoxylase I family protein